MTNEQKLLDYLKLVTADLQQTRRRLEETETQAHEPIAIVAMACRYPGGVRRPEDLWDLVAAGADAVAGPPADRGWDLPEGTANGAFLYDAADFDPAPFGLTEAEALAMDPQQRLLLETAWEAFERAGIDPSSLRGSATGVFAGLMYHDYASRLRWVPDRVAGYLGTGSTGSIASGRIAYTFGLEGPALTIDTACSSSLVALHLAAQSLRKGESALALAGGVAVMATPAPFVSFADQGGLAHDGRCRSFAAAADGVGWAEGAGLLLLERLSDARRNGHPVLAVIRGSAVNSDGASSGLTAPNGPSQQRVIRQALASARLRPQDVDVVEAHGTGTRLGDPIEAQALLATYGQDRPADAPLWLGSIKSNIGHTQAAAGAAGVMKMVYALRHGLLPKTLHVGEPTPQVDWAAGAVRLLTEPRRWPAADRPRRAGISSFGISGTNAHLILEEAPPAPEEPPTPPATLTPPLMLSAATRDALAGQAARFAEHLRSRPEEPFAEVARAAVGSRAALRHRAAVLTADRETALVGLTALAAGEGTSTLVQGVAGPSRVAMVFAGQGAQRVGMGRELYAAAPVFAAALDAICAVVDPILGESLRDVMFTGPAEKLDRTGFAQPALFAFEVALVRLLESCGVRPDAVLGHSVGELVAAHVAGALPLGEAARLVTLRGRLMQRLPAGGAMTAVEADETEALELLAGRADLAAVNAPRSVVISGDAAAVEAVAAELRSRGRRTRRLPVSHAFHSSRMDPMLAEYREAVAGVSFRDPDPVLLSTVTGAAVTAADLSDPGHWERNVRQPVRFAEAAGVLPSVGRFAVVLEIGPDAVLSPMVEQCLAGGGTAPVALPALRSSAAEPEQLGYTLARLFVAGVEVDWSAAGPRPAYRALPTYAFERSRLWLDGVPPGGEQATVAADPPVESAFWEAVERGDLDGLADTLTIGDAERESLRTLVPALWAWRRSSRAEAAMDRWRYRIAWRPFAPEAGHPVGTWLLLAPDGYANQERNALAEALTGGGARVVARTVAADRDEMAAVLRDVTAEYGDLAGVLSLMAFAGNTPPGLPGVPTGLAATLDLVHLLGEQGSGAALWCVTRHAVAVDAADEAPDPAQAQVWGLGRVVSLEHADRWGGLVDLPNRVNERTARLVAAVLADPRGEDQVAVRGSGVHVRRLRRAPLDRPRRPWRPSGTVLITGGTGGIGAHVARALAAAGAPNLLLASRRGPAAPGADALVAELAEVGCAAEAVACDMTDRRSVADLLAGIPTTRPLTAVLHTAGMAQYVPVAELDRAALADVSAGKVIGADLLDELLADRDLDAFVLFSSAAGVWGSSGGGGYAAANAHLDALAEARRRRGLRATSVAWGGWAGGGMVDALGEQMLERQGLPVMDPALAVAALRYAIEADETCVTVADVDWPRFAATFTLARHRPLIEEIPEAAAEGDTGPATRPQSALAGRLRALPEAEARDSLLRLVLDEATAVLGETAAEPVVASRAFRDMGFDSMAAVELRNRLGSAVGLRLPATLVFDHPTPERLAGYLFADLTNAGTSAATTVATAADTGEPIAIVGMACRYPGGVASPEDLWRLVVEGTDAVGAFPLDRGWDLETLFHPDPDRPATSYAKDGGFLDGAGDFDALFFGISPREAQATDPQQWLLLETSWEAFERAGINPRTLEGTQTGVFVGGASAEFAGLLAASGADILGHGLTGTSASVMSGRIAYTYGLQGPAVTIDTACSSSLVAIHLAMQSLRSGESTLALAGGVTVMATPAAFAEFSKQRGLSGDGRCRSYAAAADGTGWGEGVGLLVLERLSDAERNGHRVLAVVRGSAINQDGASNGLTAPNGPAQQQVIRQALANARLTTADVDAVEGHGTATTLGDPIEAQALLATYGQDRPADQPLWLGSIKSNIGHAQSAAGVAGVIKMVMALRHGVLPQTLHVDAPTPQVDWSAGAVRLLTERCDWPAVDRPRRAAVSSFGASGTNAHVVLEQAPEPAGTASDPTLLPVLLSARTPNALRSQARRLLDHLATVPAASVADVAFTFATTRPALEHRAGVCAEDPDGLLAALAAITEESAAADVVQGRAVTGKVVFVFPGQGAQWAGMAADLLDHDPVFTERMHECAAALAAYTDWSLLDVIRQVPGAPPLDRVDVVQPVLFAVMVCLAEMWRAAGVRPDAVIGHSQGEIAAAVFAGALTLDDGARVVALRSRALIALCGQGGMVSVALPEEETGRLIAGYGGDVSIAAVNGLGLTVVSGTPEALHVLLDRCAAEGIRARRVEVDYASHSAQVEQLRETLAELLAPVAPRAGALPLYSTLTGARLDTATMNAGYWFRNLRQPVLFRQAVAAALGDGHRAFVECGPHPVLTVGVREALDDTATTGWTGGTLRRDEDGPLRFRRSLTEAWANGVPVDWAALAGGAGRLDLDLPTYPFEHQRYWLAPRAGYGDVTAAGLASAGHPLLAAEVDLPDEEGVIFSGVLSGGRQPWLPDHAVGDAVLLPGTAFVELVIRAGDRIGCGRLAELTLQHPLVIPDEGGVRLRLIVRPAGPDGGHPAEVYARPVAAGDEVPWTRHATALLTGGADRPEDVDWPPADAEPIELEGFYEQSAEAGFRYGPAFRNLRAVWRSGDVVHAEVGLTGRERDEAGAYGLHPALLDAALHALRWSPVVERAGGGVMPFGWSGVTLHATGADALRVRLTVAPSGEVRIDGTDLLGTPVLTVEALTMRPAGTAVAMVAEPHNDALFRVEWSPVPAAVEPGPRAVTILGEASPALACALAQAGYRVNDDLSGLVLVPCPPAGDANAERVHAAVQDALRIVQDCLADSARMSSTLVFVTEKAVATTPGEDVRDLVHAPLWGLIRSAQTENPGRFRLLDVGDAAVAGDVLAAALDSGEPQAAIRAGVVRVPRLVRSSSLGSLRVPAGLDPSGTVLITGGTGALGALFARHLVSAYGVRHLLLVSRRGTAAAGAERLAEDLRGSGADVRVAACDVADRAALAELLATIPAEHPLTGVVHAAGVLDDGAVAALTAEQVDRVVRSKVDAALNLHELTADHDLAMFVLFSSTAGVLGGAGQANYAAASAFLDALAQRRRAAGLAGLSMAWGPWAEHSDTTGSTVRSWRYRVRWKPVPGAAGPSPAGVWLVVSPAEPDDGLDGLVTALGGEGVRVRRVRLPDDPGECAGFAAALVEAAGDTAPAGVLYRPPAGDLTGALLLVQTLLDLGWRVPVWWLTSGAVSVGRADPPPVPARAQVWGFARVAALEHPELWGGLIDVPPMADEAVADRVVALLGGGTGGEDQVAVRASGMYARRMVRAAPEPLPAASWRPRGTVLVTGGTGAIGGRVARWLARSGAEHVVLTSRRGSEAAGAAELCQELRALGAEVTVAACDVTDRAALAGLLDRVGPLSAVVHAAGVGQFTMIADTGVAELDAVLAGKVEGARHLHELLDRHELDAFVLFSSGAAVWGSAGQSAYAAANAYLDALAEARRSRGVVATSVAWGSWAGGGMVDDGADALLRRRGVRRMDPEMALLAMRDAVEGAEPSLVVADVDWADFVPTFTLTRRRPLIEDIPEVGEALRALRAGPGDADGATVLRETLRALTPDDGRGLFDAALGVDEALLVPVRIDVLALRRRYGPAAVPPMLRGMVRGGVVRRSAGTSAEAAGTALAARLARMPVGERRRTLYETVRGHVAAVLGDGVREAMEPERPFKDLGFDSLSAVELRDRLGAAMGIRLPVTLVFDHPTPAAVVDLLLGEFGESAVTPPAGSSAPAGTDEPIAIVGMSCRYPGGVTTPEDLWRLVAAGADAVADIPVERGWDLERLYGGKAAVQATAGGFLVDVAGFDAAFFGISPREAAVMDPQQRLLLETAWEALERAGTDPTSIRGTRTGVFVGGSSQDYVAYLSSVGDEAAGHLLSGTAGSVLSGRLAYVLGAEGPTITVDTACSSSLVALHLAAQSLRSGESDLALAGGVSVLFTPVLFAEFSRQGGLAPDGRCKAFAAAADGTGWAEGAGLLVLERLSEARRNGRRILAVLRGSAVNQDGASNGLTAPNGPSQQRVIRQALTAAGLTPGDVDAVEAHGTGTTLGDPIEAQALLATYGRERSPESPLWLGSIKSNIGHAQAAAGVAGVIKMVQALRHEVLPSTLHVDEPSPEVDWSAGAVRLLTEARDWPRGAHPRRAGVSAFGISGTNAHVILEEAPVEQPLPAAPTPAEPLPVLLSASSADALAAQAARLREHLLAHPDLNPAAVARALLAGRAQLRYRAAMRTADRDGLLAALGTLTAGGTAPGLLRGTARSGPVAVVFPGQGSQRHGMGRELYQRHPVFRTALNELHAGLVAAGGPADLLDVMFGEDDARLHRTGYAQPALFAYEVALYRLLESFGVRADMVAGHSIGELVAAHVSGALTAADTCRVVVARGALMQRLPGGGAMTAVGAPEAEVAEVLAGRADLAAVNGPRSVVISGDVDAVEALATELAARGDRTRSLTVSHAFHSSHMTPMLDEFAEVTTDLPVAAPELTMISTVTGGVVGSTELADPDHWRRNVRSTVRFAAAVEAALRAGATTILEVGPDAVLTPAVHETLEETDPARRPAVVAVARNGRADPETLLDALTGLHVTGAAVDWPAVHGPGPAQAADLPTYPFQHQHYWLSPTANAARGDVATAGLSAVEHPLLSAVLDQPETGGVTLTGALSLRTHPWLADHAVAGVALFPGTAFAELLVRAGDAAGCDRLDELVLEAPLLVPVDEAVAIQVVVGAAGPGERRPVHVFAKAGAAGTWMRHATGTVRPDPGTTRPTGPAAWPPPEATPVELDGFHDRIAERGLAYGPSFRGLRAAWRDGDVLYLEAALPAEADGFALHPALFDAVLQGVALERAGDVGVPFSFTGFTVYATGATAVRARLSGTPAEGFQVAIFDVTGRPVAAVESLALRTLDPRQTTGSPAGLLAPEWIAPPRTVEAPPRREMWVLTGAAGPEAGRRLAAGGLLLVEDPDPAGALGHGVTRHAVTLVRPDAALGDLPAGVHDECARLLSILQDWLAADVPAGSRLVVLTERAVAVRPDEDVTGLAGAAVHGLVRAAQAEHPDRIVLVDVDDVTRSAGLLPLATATALELDEPVIAVRDGELRLPRLVPVAAAEPAARPEHPGSVLVVGASGALGGLVARHLVSEHGVRDLLLVSRRGVDAPGAVELAADLAGLGARATWAACDAADRGALEALLDAAEPPVTGIVHAGGVLDDGVVTALTPDRLAGVLRPKADAAWHLHQLTERHPVSMFVLFSSVSGIFGNAGQANYAAANAFLDALAVHRHAQGLPATSLAWGLWDVSGGMAAQVEAVHWSRSGAEGLTAEQGLARLDAALGHSRPVIVPMRLDRAQPGGGPLPPLLWGTVRTRAVARAAEDAPSDLSARLEGLVGPERQAAIHDLVRAAAAGVLGHPDPVAIAEIDVFAELGFDSLMSVELRNALAAATGVRLATTLVFDHPTISGLAAELHDRLTADLGAVKPQEAAAEPGEEEYDGDGTTLAALYRRASELGEYADGTTMLQLASRFRPSFSTPEESSVRPELIRLCAGPDDPPLICFPSPTVFGGPHEYTPLATVLRGRRDVWSPVYPGFVAGERLPADFAALVDFLAAGVLARTDGKRCTILGRSSGGTVAHLVAARLEELGAQVSSLVLLDTYPPSSSALHYILPVLQKSSLDAEAKVGPMTDVRLTAMAGYFGFFGEWSMKPVKARTVLIRASELVPTDEPPRNEAEWRSSWPLEHTVVDVPGDHFTMMTDRIDSTVAAIEEWTGCTA
ncbi:polyketide synthase [Micromonospora tulbaghiae]|uniref:Polyketide synthase n=1 Tax=Micromonospora tulbaghiae TaxID=479978 RepID=A0A386WWV4_9ACTN|nr:type I polyketide synthase [Micromonospora tulbaghiae]AYF31968.1 polyketide synthase [Micromonospora tulbaghiae]